MPDMPRPRPPHLQRQVTRHGKVAWYVRLGRGPKVRIKGTYGGDEFNAAYSAAVCGEKPAAPGSPGSGTLAWLAALHRKSAYWSALAPGTRKQRDNIFRQVLKTAGRSPLAAIDAQAIKEGRDRRAKTPSQARNFVNTMRSLFKWALDSELVKADPTATIKAKKSKTGGIPPWTDEDIAKFEKRWPRGTRERVMFDVFIYTGFRIGDVAVVGKQHTRGGVIALDTEKGSSRVTVPMLAPLARTLKAGPVGDLAYIAAANGNPLLKNSLGNAFRKACRAAGVNKSGHGLRKAAATHAAEQGATVAELEAIFGWHGGQMAALYTKAANRKKLAAGAMSKLDRTKSGTSMLPPEKKVVASGQNNK